MALLNEEHTTVSESGKLTTTTRSAVRMLTRQGASAIFSEQYDTASGKVRDFKAWTISPSGKVKKYGKDEILDVACAENDVYNQCRRRVVSNRGDVEVGAIFGYEATVESQIFSNQLRFAFQQSTAPVKLARYAVTLPGAGS